MLCCGCGVDIALLDMLWSITDMSPVSSDTFIVAGVSGVDKSVMSIGVTTSSNLLDSSVCSS